MLVLRKRVAALLLGDTIEDRTPAKFIPSSVEFGKEFRRLPQTKRKVERLRAVMSKFRCMGVPRLSVAESSEAASAPLCQPGASGSAEVVGSVTEGPVAPVLPTVADSQAVAEVAADAEFNEVPEQHRGLCWYPCKEAFPQRYQTASRASVLWRFTLGLPCRSANLAQPFRAQPKKRAEGLDAVYMGVTM